MVSLPIPYAGDENRYSDLRVDDRSLLEVMRELGYASYDESSSCHLDPDINRVLCQRPAEWRGLFGQVDAALGHLQNQGVGVGDLLCFGAGFSTPSIRRAGCGSPAGHFTLSTATSRSAE